jgi:hypothetical protein
MQLGELKERLEAGANLTTREVQALAHVGNTKFYKDLKNGRVRVRKFGSRNLITAADARAYIEGRPMPQDAA